MWLLFKLAGVLLLENIFSDTQNVPKHAKVKNVEVCSPFKGKES